MFYLNVWLTVQDATQIERIAALLSQLGNLSRQEPGCLRFEVYHSEADPTRFLLSERWETRSHWETHRTAAAFTEIYQPQVLPFVNREPHISRLLD